MANKYPGWSPYNYCTSNPLIIIDPNGLDWFYYQNKDEKEAQWHWQEGSTATYIDADGNEQTTNLGFEYLIKFTIMEEKGGHVTGKLEMWHQNNKFDFINNETNERTDYLNAFAGDSKNEHLKLGNWYVDTSVRPKLSITKDGHLAHIDKGIQLWENEEVTVGNRTISTPGWGSGRMKMNYGLDGTGGGYYCHDNARETDYTLGCLATHSEVIVKYFYYNSWRGIVPIWVGK